MTVVDDSAGLVGWTAFGDELVRRIVAEAAKLHDAASRGDDLQVQISSSGLEDLYALADRHDISRDCLP